MSVLVTGGCGFIGRHLVAALAARGEDVVAFDVRALAAQELAGNGAAHVRVVRGDVTDQRRLAKVMRTHSVTSVVHAASIVGVAASAHGASEAVRVNVEGALQVFDAACDLGGVRRLVDLSSEEVYGHFAADPMPEDGTREPISPYGISKLAVEQLGGYYAHYHGLPYVAARLCWVYGPSFPRKRLPNAWLQDIASGTASVLEAGGDQTTDFTHIDDAVAGVLALHDAEDLRHRAYNVATGRATSVAALAEMLRDGHPGWQVDVGPGPLQLARGVLAARKGALCISRIGDELGFRPAVCLRDGLERTLQDLTRPTVS